MRMRLLGALLTVVTLSACADSGVQGEAENRRRTVITGDTVAANPSGKSIRALVDESLSADGRLGAIVGVVTGDGVSHDVPPVPNGDSPGIGVVTDFAFDVEKSLGASRSVAPFRTGDSVCLRVAGGSTAREEVVVTPQLDFSVGERVLIFVQRQERLSEATEGCRVVVVQSEGYVARVDGNDLVFTAGRLGIAEAMDRLNAKPAR